MHVRVNITTGFHSLGQARTIDTMLSESVEDSNGNAKNVRVVQGQTPTITLASFELFGRAVER